MYTESSTIIFLLVLRILVLILLAINYHNSVECIIFFLEAILSFTLLVLIQYRLADLNYIITYLQIYIISYCNRYSLIDHELLSNF